MTSSAHTIPYFLAASAVAPRPVGERRDYRLEAVVFQEALVALAAKLATIDGAPNASEYAAFHAQFVEGSAHDALKMRDLFVTRATDKSSVLRDARQIVAAKVSKHGFYENVLARLLQIAIADGELNAAELELLRAVSDVFGIRKDTFQVIIRQAMVPVSASPYDVLGISAKASDSALREHYMARVQKLHPDRYQAAGASAATIAMLSDQLSAVNAAYQSVQKARAKKSSQSRATRLWHWKNKGADTVTV